MTVTIRNCCITQEDSFYGHMYCAGIEYYYEGGGEINGSYIFSGECITVDNDEAMWMPGTNIQFIKSEEPYTRLKDHNHLIALSTKTKREYKERRAH